MSVCGDLTGRRRGQNVLNHVQPDLQLLLLLFLEVAVSGPGRGPVRVDADVYIETFRRETRRRLDEAVSESGRRWDRGIVPGRRM